MDDISSDAFDPSPPAQFATTRWSLVVDAGGSGGLEARRALGELAEQYWYPLYAFARRRGASPEDAQDWTQGFLAQLLERAGFFAAADPERGRFRAFLIHAFKHYVGQQKAKSGAIKRGGQLNRLDFFIDFADGERRYAVEPVDEMTADRLFDRRWAMSLLAKVLGQLDDYYRNKGKDKFFEACRGYLMTGDVEPQAELAETLGMTPGNLRTSLHRMRAKYRDLLRQEVGETVASESDIDAELAALQRALRSR